MNLGTLWDFIDKRDIDKHLVSIVILYGTVRLTRWAMAYASLHCSEGANAAMIIAAVAAPYMALQAAALKWYFDARSGA